MFKTDGFSQTGSALLQPLPSGVMHLEQSLQSHRMLPFPSGPPPPSKLYRAGLMLIVGVVGVARVGFRILY